VSSLSKITRESLILINIFLNVTVKLSDFDVSNGKTIDVKNAFYVFYFGHFFTFLTFFLFFKRFLFKKTAKFRAAGRLTRSTFKITATE